MSKIEIVSNAMELRGFGKHKKRTWYMARKFKAGDVVSIVFCVLMVCVALFLNYLNKGRFYNPFV